MFPSHLQSSDFGERAVSTQPHRHPKLHTMYLTAPLDLFNLLLNFMSTVTLGLCSTLLKAPVLCPTRDSCPSFSSCRGGELPIGQHFHHTHRPHKLPLQHLTPGLVSGTSQSHELCSFSSWSPEHEYLQGSFSTSSRTSF